MATLFAVALLTWFAYLLFDPLRRPVASLVLLRSPSETMPGVAAAPYGERDAAALSETIAPQLLEPPIPLSSDVPPNDLFGPRLRAVAQDCDVLLIYVQADVAIDDGRAVLFWGRDTGESEPRAYPVRDLLAGLAAHPATTKVLLLDAAGPGPDHRFGRLDETFTSKLIEDCRAADENIRVLVSHSDRQHSHVSASLDRSMFAYGVERGLAGSADRDRDGYVRLSELHDYVATTVAAWVRETTGGRESQTPLLLTCGPAHRHSLDPLLVPAPRWFRRTGDDATLRRDVAQAKEDRLLAVSLKEPDAVSPAAGETSPPTAAEKSTQAVKAKSDTIAKSGLNATSSAVAKVTPAATGGDAAQSSVEPEAAEGTSSNGAAVGAGGSGESAATAATAPQRTAPQLLADGWRLRDRLEAGTTSRADPRRDAPHLWRAFVAKLYELEQKVLTGSEADRVDATRSLRRLVPSLDRWAAGGPADDDADEPARSLMATLPAGAAVAAGSFGLAESIAAANGSVVPAELASVIATYDRHVSTGDREAFAKWIAELPPASRDFTEIRLAEQLTSLPALDDEIVNRALTTRRLAEQVGSTAEAAEWLPASIAQADDLRCTAESILLQELGPKRQLHAERLLSAARARYETAADDVATLRDAANLRDTLFDLAPQIVAWRQASESLPGPRSPTFADVMALLGAIGELADALAEPTHDDLERVESAASRARTLLAAVQAGRESSYLQSVLAVPPDPADDLLRLRALLSTTLPAADDRTTLRTALQRADESLLLSIPFSSLSSSSASPATASPSAVLTDDRRLVERVQLEARLASLAVADAGGDAIAPVVEARDDVVARANAIVAAESDVDSPGVDLGPFEDVLGEFWRGTLPRLAGGPSTAWAGDVALSDLRAASRALRMLDARDALQIDSFPTSRLRAAMQSKLLSWQARRIERALQVSPADRIVDDVRLAERYRRAAADLVRRDPDRRSPRQIAIEGSSVVSLEEARTATVELSVENSLETAADVWLIVDYDPSLVAIDAESAALFVPAWRLEQQQDGPSPGVVDPLRLNRPDRDGETPPTFRLPAGGQRRIAVSLERLAGDGRPTRFVVRAVATPVEAAVPGGDKPLGGNTGDGGNDQTPVAVLSERPAVFARRDVAVALPSVAPARLIVEGPPGTVAGDGNHPVLAPFPNRSTPFRMLLAGRTQSDVVVDVELYPVRTDLAAFGALPAIDTLPTDVGVDANVATGLLARWTDGVPLFAAAELALPADGTPIAMPFPKPAPAEAGVALPTTEQGLLVVVTDRATGRKSLLPVSFRPQHPRRYLEPTVGYNADAERIELAVAPRDDSLLPPGGSRVSCTVIEGLSPIATRRLEGVVTADGPPATMFVETTGLREPIATLHVTVDGYPRAFLYRVPLDTSRDDVPAESDASAVRITMPRRGAAYRSPLAAVPVAIEVDAPVGSRWDLGESVEIGFDRDRDRELRGERTVSLYSDRQFLVTVEQLLPGGGMSIGTTVDDFRIELPADHLERGRVNILGRLAAGGRVAWSIPVEVAVDDVAPTIARVRLSRRQVLAGEPLGVVAEANDGDLSGIAQVYAGVDLARTGEFAGEPPPIAAANEAGRWIASIDTSALLPGPYYVLVRAVDAVGIAGPYARERFDVVTVEQQAAARASAVNDVAGFVQYRGRPMGAFEVTLEPLPPAQADGEQPAPEAPATNPLPPVTTTSDGSFMIKGVPPGRYRATAGGLYNNRRRTGSVEIDVAPFPVDVPPVEIEVDPRG